MKQNPTVSELKIEACLHHSGHEIDASKIRLERNEVGPSQDLHGRYGLTGMVSCGQSFGSAEVDPRFCAVWLVGIVVRK